MRVLSARSRLARWLVVLLLAFAAPAVQDVLTDLTMWMTGQMCCADDCDEGSPCSQPCAHCPCGTVRAAPLQTGAAEASVVAGREAIVGDPLLPPTSAVLDPPFRPPVS